MSAAQSRERSLRPSYPALPYGVKPIIALTGLYVSVLHLYFRLCRSHTAIKPEGLPRSQKLSEMDIRNGRQKAQTAITPGSVRALQSYPRVETRGFRTAPPASQHCRCCTKLDNNANRPSTPYNTFLLLCVSSRFSRPARRKIPCRSSKQDNRTTTIPSSNRCRRKGSAVLYFLDSHSIE